MLGGTLVEPNEISPGEWRAKTATGGQKVTIKKGDLIFVPRGTPHQRTVTGKGFSMILIKIFADRRSRRMDCEIFDNESRLTIKYGVITKCQEKKPAVFKNLNSEKNGTTAEEVVDAPAGHDPQRRACRPATVCRRNAILPSCSASAVRHCGPGSDRCRRSAFCSPTGSRDICRRAR